MLSFAHVVLNLPIDRPFSYEIPPELQEHVKIGSRLRVPFQDRDREGFCIGISGTAEIPFVRKVKSVLDEDPTADARLLDLARWIADRYVSSWGEAIFASIPSGARKRNPGRKIALLRLASDPGDPGNDARKRVVEILRDGGGTALQSEVLSRAPRSAVEALVRLGTLRREFVAPAIDLLADALSEPPKEIALTPEQERALEEIARGPGAVLLHGVTGSGKTEVYLRAIARAVREGRQSIVLVPEIALTPQTVSRFRSRFPRTAVLHSLLTEAERGAQWRAVRRGEIDVVIGARSAVFAPVAKLGLIVIDEEHEPAFKQENPPRYHAREVALRRAAVEGGTVVLGSATPSLESLHRARQGEFRLARLPRRIGGRDLPPVEIVDMIREVQEAKRMALISRPLRRAVEGAAKRGEQSILFLNRRGFTTGCTCRRCGWALRCRRCDILLTFHKETKSALCHYCGRSEPPPQVCPDCKTGTLKFFGAGTEKVEEEIRGLFPALAVGRMDSDAMKTRRHYREALGGLWTGDTDIVVGTQMIAKGLDVPNVTVVGVISADTAFQLPDFRSAERTFQLITQVAGRAGRGPAGGRVIVQTYNPAHYSITCAAAYDTEKFLEKELEMRRELGYPPFRNLVRVVVQGSDEDRVRKTCETFATRFREKIDALFADLLGPAPAPIYRIKSRYRMHCLIKTAELSPVLEALRSILPGLSRSRAVQVAADVDPVSML